MIHWWTRKDLVLVAAAASLVFVAVVVVMVGLAYPEPVPSVLGPDWQCSRLAFVFTSCSRVVRGEQAFVRIAGKPACQKPK